MGRKKQVPGLIMRAGVWHIEKRIFGRRICQSTGTAQLEEAERHLARIMEQVRQAQVFGVRPSRTFEQAAAKFVRENQHKRSLASDIVQLKLLMPHIGELALERLHRGALHHWVEKRQAQRMTAGTINHGLKVVRRILNLAATEWVDEHGLTWLASAPKIKLLSDDDKRQPYPLSWTEQSRLFRHLPLYLAQMALFAVNTGCRDGEVCRLRWEWEIEVPQLKSSVFIIPPEHVKNGEARLVVLNRIALAVVEAQRGLHPTHVFTYEGHAINRMLTSGWIRARNKAGLPQVRVHDLKHTFGRRLRAAGVSFEDRQDLLGHRSGRITSHYSAAELGRLIEAVNRVCVRDEKRCELVVLRGTLKGASRKSPAISPNGSRGGCDKPLKIMVPRGGIEPPTP
jgi:integrase